MTPQDAQKESTKYFLVKEYYECVKSDLSQEELQNLVTLIAKDIKPQEIAAE